MSFDTLKIKDLKNVADNFAVEYSPKTTKQQLILLLEEEGVTYDTYKRFFESEKVEPELSPRSQPVRTAPTSTEDIVLVKMDRNNFTYEVDGFMFTKQHPFMPMESSRAQSIFDIHDGFRLATPREAQEYYR
jgi:parvulin-like peptidyl-prolyl isomerase